MKLPLPPGRPRARLLPVVASLLLITLTTSSCLVEYSFERDEVERGTLGQEIYRVWHRDTARSATRAPERTALLEARRDDFVTAVDTAAPAGSLDDLDLFLKQVVTLVREDITPGLSRKLTEALEEAADDPELLDALSRSTRPDASTFASNRTPSNFLSYMLGYEHAPDLNRRLADALLRADGLDDQGAPRFAESSALSDVLRAWRRSSLERDAASNGDTPNDDTSNGDGPSSDAEPWAITLQRMLLTADARYAAPDAPGPLYVARFDERGMPLVTREGGAFPSPFVDRDGDGLADIDARGRFVMPDGSARAIPAFELEPAIDDPIARDAHGRAYRSSERFLFEYVDINQTGLGYLVRTSAELGQREVLHHGLMAAVDVMGPAVASEDALGVYPGFPSDHPLLDVLHALVHALDIPNVAGALEAVASLLERAHAQIAGIVHAVDHAADALARHPDAGLADNQTILHDLLPVLAEMSADPALWADVMEAMRDPIVKRAGEPMLTLVTHKNVRAVPELGGPYDRCFDQCKARHTIGTEARFDCIRACPAGEIFSVPMDLSAPESEANRSQFSRMFHLLRDATGLYYGMDLIEARVPGVTLPPDMPPLVELHGAAEAFIRAVAGELDLADIISPRFNDSDLGQLIVLLDYILPVDLSNQTLAVVLSHMSELFGVKLDVRPTPDQITRLFNKTELRFANDEGTIVLAIPPPVCHDGYVMALHHADGLYAAEASGMIDVLYPLARVFARHDREDLLAQLFVIVHDHYSSRTDLYRTAAGALSPMKGSNLVSFEPALTEILSAGHLFEALHAFAVATRGLKSPDGVDLDEHVRRLLHQATRSDDGFTTRSGAASITLADGRTVRELSRLAVVLDGIDRAVDAVPDDSPARDHLEEAASGLLDVLFAVDKPQGQPAAFRDPGSLALAGHAARQIASRARAMEARGELSRWLSQELMADIEETWASRGFFALIRLASEIFADEATRRRLDDFLQYAAARHPGYEYTSTAVYFALLQSVQAERWVPLARYLAGLLDPDRAWAQGPREKLPLASHLALAVRRTSELDAAGNGPALLHRGLHSSAAQPAPFSVLGSLIADYFRADPLSDEPLDAADYALVMRSIGDWLADDVHGFERYYELVRAPLAK